MNNHKKQKKMETKKKKKTWLKRWKTLNKCNAKWKKGCLSLDGCFFLTKKKVSVCYVIVAKDIQKERHFSTSLFSSKEKATELAFVLVIFVLKPRHVEIGKKTWLQNKDFNKLFLVILKKKKSFPYKAFFEDNQNVEQRLKLKSRFHFAF